ncbi:MAG: alpha/beta hydrolase [Nitrosomonadales bacterium]|nr:alpha/beta hydrolase [Nitrosomonadales bacterium]
MSLSRSFKIWPLFVAAALTVVGPTVAAAPRTHVPSVIPTQYRYATVGGIRLFYREAGDPAAPVVVLLHGFPSSSHMYRELIPLLADKFHVIAPDLPGYGYSDMPAADQYDYTFDNLTTAVQGLLNQLGLTNYVLYMHDYGGLVGLRIAAAEPKRVKGLVIQNANAYLEGVSDLVGGVFLPLWKEQNDTTVAAARTFLTAETTKFQYTQGAHNPAALNPDAWTLDQALLDRPGNAAIQLKLFVNYQTNVALYDAWHAYFREHQPKTLVVWGRGDPLFTVAGAEAYKNDLKHIEVRYYDGGHFALEEYAGDIAAQIKRVFAK